MHRNLDVAKYGAKLATFAKVNILVLLAIAAFTYAAPASSQTPVMTFTVETTTQGASAVVPRITWSTTPAAGGCTASATPADTDWAGAKAAAGTVILPALTATKSFALVCNWPGNLTALVTWAAPTTNQDGSAYTNPGGFRIQYGRTPSTLDQSVYLQDPAARQWRSPELAVGSWSFGVRAFNEQGLESPISNVATKVTTAGTSQTRTHEVVVKFPNAPTDVKVE